MNSFELFRDRLVRADEDCRRSYVESLRQRYKAWESGVLPLAGLCAEAGDALEAYAAETLITLVTAAPEHPECEAAQWIPSTFKESIGRAGADMRDAIDDSTARHAVAQALQACLLRAESQLRNAITTLGAPPGP
jgi:hypothetical protein